MKALEIAGVPVEKHPWIASQQKQAKKAAKGMLWHKIKARLWYGPRAAAKLPWDAERLPEDQRQWDIAPVLNVTANGDSIPWEVVDGVSKPRSEYWLNPDPKSAEYHEAINANYWKPGHHPRSRKARKAWYRRNGGEYAAWRRGKELYTPGVSVWNGERGRVRVTVVGTSNVYLIHTSTRLVGKLRLIWRTGYEVDNVAWRSLDSSGWVPMPGDKHRAPLTWGWRLRWHE